MPAVGPGTHGAIFFLESTQKIVQTSVRAFVCKGAIGLHSKFQNMITLHHSGWLNISEDCHPEKNVSKTTNKNFRNLIVLDQYGQQNR